MLDELDEGEVTVEIIYPAQYVENNIKTMGRYASAVSLICKAAATLGKDETEFDVSDISVVQVYTLESTLESFGIKLVHDMKRVNGVNHVHFYADVRELREKMGIEE